jgi:hypothetical protein
MDLGHGLEVQQPIFAGIEPQLVLTECVVIVALLPVGQPEIEVRERCT